MYLYMDICMLLWIYKKILIFDSVEHSGGQRVRLDLQNLDHFSIFPGQVLKTSMLLYVFVHFFGHWPIPQSSSENEE